MTLDDIERMDEAMITAEQAQALLDASRSRYEYRLKRTQRGWAST